MTSDRQRLFVQTIAAIFQARQEVADLFFQHKVTETVQAILESHIQYCVAEEGVRRHQAFKEYLKALYRAESLFEEVSYLKKGDPIAFAVARERILYYARMFLAAENHVPEKKTEAPSTPLKTDHTPTDSSDKNLKLGGTREKILEFVRQAPERRAKDIIDEFSALSGRTVKRGLKELSRDGLIVRKETNNAVYYSAVN